MQVEKPARGLGETETLEARLHAHLATRAARYWRFIAGTIPRDLQGQLSPEDVLQEVWITAFRGIGRVKLVGPDALDRWLMTTVKRRLIDALRTARRLKRGGKQRFSVDPADRSASFLALFDRVVPQGRTPSGEASAREAELAVRLALAALPKDQRSAIELYYIAGKTRADVAREMQTTLSAVNSLLYRARENLRGRLGSASTFFSGTHRLRHACR